MLEHYLHPKCERIYNITYEPPPPVGTLPFRCFETAANSFPQCCHRAHRPYPKFEIFVRMADGQSQPDTAEQIRVVRLRVMLAHLRYISLALRTTTYPLRRQRGAKTTLGESRLG